MTEIAPDPVTDKRQSSPKRHFATMDGLRGVAAMTVVLFHSFLGGGLVTNGPLAVDLFFLLSGFVIAYSYDDRLRGGMTASEFVARRLIRLYPMVLVGAVGGILLALLHNKINPSEAYPLGSVVSSGGLSLAVLPYLGHDISDKAFSFNPPLWSLSFELAANLFYVMFARRLSNFVLTTIVILGLAGITIGGPLGGVTKPTILLGFPRVACGFFGGVLLFRLWRSGKLPTINGNFLVLSGITLIVFCIPKTIDGWAFVPIYALFITLIVCAAGAKSSRFDKYLLLLGEISYPLYLIHWLTLYVFTALGSKLGFNGPKYIFVAMSHWLCAPVIAYFIARYYEMPMRRILTKLWNVRFPMRLAALRGI